jgi:hypothetical protein
MTPNNEEHHEVRIQRYATTSMVPYMPSFQQLLISIKSIVANSLAIDLVVLIDTGTTFLELRIKESLKQAEERYSASTL